MNTAGRRPAPEGALLQHYTMIPRGGHFAPMKEPQLLVEDIRTFFLGLRG
jgi:hypothetical protein